jgi:RNA polymerase sigma-70 factor (ECF subfamily)
MMELDERALIEAAKGGDPEAFGVMVEHYMPKALGFATKMMGNAEDAKDVTQEAFVKAYRSLGSYRREAGFATWFFRVLSNACTDHLRKASLMRRVFFFSKRGEEEGGAEPLEEAADPHPGAGPEEDMKRRELGLALTRALMSLTARQRAVFLLKHYDGMKFSDIAAIIGISEGAVKSHMARAVTALRTRMKDQPEHG